MSIGALIGFPSESVRRPWNEMVRPACTGAVEYANGVLVVRKKRTYIPPTTRSKESIPRLNPTYLRGKGSFGACLWVNSLLFLYNSLRKRMASPGESPLASTSQSINWTTNWIFSTFSCTGIESRVSLERKELIVLFVSIFI